MSAENLETRMLEKLLAMGKRLAGAIEGDIAALERGAFDQLHTADPEIANLAMVYTREVAALKKAGGIGKTAPAKLVTELKELGARLKVSLVQHERLVMCMRQASEGLVQAVAEEVEKTRSSAAPYTPHTKGKAQAGAIVYNKVV